MPSDVVLAENEVRVVDGDLVVRTTDGTQRLRIEGETGALRFESAETPMLYIQERGTSEPDRPIIAHSPPYPNYGLLYRDRTDQMIFQGGGRSALAVALGTRRVGVGTDKPTTTLEVDGTISATQPFRTLSDARAKRAVASIDRPLDTLRAMNGVTFEWDTATDEVEFDADELDDGRRLGFLAQDLAEIVPEVVSEDETGRYLIEQGSLVPLLVEAVKEQSRQVDDLTERVERQREQLAEQETVMASLAERVDRLEAAKTETRDA